MGKGEYPGEFELVVLSAIAALPPGTTYGMNIRMHIEERTGRDVSIGAVYATLRRMERKGLIRSDLGEPTPERGGRAKRFFALRTAGVDALAQARDMFSTLWSDLPEFPS